MPDPPINAAELLEALRRSGITDEASPLPGAGRTVRFRSHGIQIAHVPLRKGRGNPEKKLAQFWRDRVGNTALRLIAVADALDSAPERHGSLLVFGPHRKAPIRSLPGTVLLRILSDAMAQESGVLASRQVTAALARYDRAETPGLAVRGLLTSHTLTERFLRLPRWHKEREEAAHAVARLAPDADWAALLRGLGWNLAPLPDRGWLAQDGSKPIAVILPFAPGTDLAKLDSDGRPPEGRLLALCEHHDLRYGILASGERLRLFDARSPGAASIWLELDAAALGPEERPLLALLGPETLARGRFEELSEDARAHGVRLWRRLGDRVHDRALPALARGLGDWARESGRDTSHEAVRRDLQHASFTLVFRLLFLFYAESAGFLPVGNPIYRGKSLTALADSARRAREKLDRNSTALWTNLRTLTLALRSGNPAWGVPAYNGALFHPEELEGARTLEEMELADPEFAEVLIALGSETGQDGTARGVDYTSLEIGHLGNIYESLLSLSLSVTDRPTTYDPSSDRYRHERHTGNIPAGSLIWQNHEGGRKAGGVYYTPTTLVRHLVDRAVRPAYREHLDRVRETAERDPLGAAKQLLDFAVVDPACGSGHFLVAVVDALADEAARFLARHPLPALRDRLDALRTGTESGPDGGGGDVEDLALLRRLLVKHSVFGVDVSPMGAEIATVSLWLAAFVPGLSLSYLGRNVAIGNSLFGVADRDAVIKPNTFEAQRLADSVGAASEALAAVAENPDRNPAEYEASQQADRAANALTAGLRHVFDLWTADPFGEPGNRHQVAGKGFRVLTGDEELPMHLREKVRRAEELAREHSFLHWPIQFPRVFARQRPGFDAVVGNPPWEEVTVEELGFYTLFLPGVNSLPSAAREAAVADLIGRKPELRDRLAAEQERVKSQRAALGGGGFESTSGDPDLYKFFCQRYRVLLRSGGYLGVVLPRSAFNAKGSAGFREWLHRQTSVRRVDFLLNKGRWAFDAEPRYSIALVAAQNVPSPARHRVEVAGTADSEGAWARQTGTTGIRLSDSAFGPDRQLPLLRTQEEVDLLTKIRRGSRFPLGPAGRWKCFAVAELHETNDKKFWQSGTGSRQLWKGSSFDQYDPHGADSRPCAVSGALWRKIRKPRPGSGQLVGGLPLTLRREAVLRELGRARVAFRDVTNRTNSRTVLACLIPAKVLLSNTAPYLAFVEGDEKAQSVAVGILNSLPFDWQARRYVEMHVSLFILNSLVVPDLNEEDFEAISDAAARLSAVDDRYADFAAATGVPCGELPGDERERLRVEIDARVARAWNLTASDLEVLLADFTTRGVPAVYRTALRQRFGELR
ncbi:MAG: hypothetical protein F4Z74_07810 [Acidobacteria bacterium]|nr:hypothetical protein [Acidobacteriota bacterium]MYE44451.1 hypothetical protein [Acidobacteriota bacterium]